MPPLPRIRVPMLAELARELRYAPRAALLRAAERAESLAAALSPGSVVPAEWVVFKITGYRPERWPEEPGLTAADGGDVRAGLSALVEFLTHQAAWTIGEATAAHAVTRAELARSWSVSEKTIDRFRAEGLIARRALREDGKPVLVFLPGPVAWSQQAFATRLVEPVRPARMTQAERARLVRLAERCRRRFGCSLNQTAKALAPRVDRSLEAVRQVLRAEDERRSRERLPLIFGDPPPLEARHSRWMFRAWKRGAEPSDLAEHARCSRAAAQRAINLRRAALLAGVAMPGGKPLSLAELDKSGDSVTDSFGQPGPTDLAALVASARVRTVMGPKQEHTLLQRYASLRLTATAWTGSTPHANPQSEPLDVAETCLRWASLVKVELMRPLLTLAVETVEAVLERPIETLGATDVSELLRIQLSVLAESIDHADPSRTGRLAGAAALALSTAASRWAKTRARASTKAGSRASVSLPAGLATPDWTRNVASWQGWLEPDARIRGQLDRMPAQSAALLRLRFGWSGERPRTQTEAAARLGLSRIALPRAERAAIRLSLELARGIKS
jgi:RNA polymerase primary sigma factor